MNGNPKHRLAFILASILASFLASGCTQFHATETETRSIHSENTPESASAAADLTPEEIAGLTPAKVVLHSEDVTDTEASSNSQWTASPTAPSKRNNQNEVDPTTILGTIAGLVMNPLDRKLWSLVGQQAWTIVDKNKPVLNYSDRSVSVLPSGYKNWQSMERWKIRARTIHLDIKNLYGMTVVSQAYTIKYNYGGQMNGHGGYLANVSVAPTVSVVIGYRLDSAVEFSRVVNVGTEADPVPGIELRIGWNVKTILKEAKEADSFFIQGDGQISHLGD
jgi:hypothetical protein